MEIKPLIIGSIKRISFNLKHAKLRGTDSAEYCYSVWLRNLVHLNKNGMKNHPKTIVELGPGNSIGVGLAALLTGSEKYYGLDTTHYANNKDNLIILNKLIELFNKRTPIPNNNEFPKMNPKLENYSFPKEILTEDYLKKALNQQRIENIKKALLNINSEGSHNNIRIFYKVPWFGKNIIKNKEVDLIFSQAVMEHILYFKKAYLIMYNWLKEKGFMCHQIDYKSHTITKKWYGHWQYPTLLWNKVVQRKDCLLNRKTHSQHLKIIKEIGFKLIKQIKVKPKNKPTKEKLSKEFQNLPEDDFITSSAFIIAQK
jgi:hypothetical protein